MDVNTKQNVTEKQAWTLEASEPSALHRLCSWEPENTAGRVGARGQGAVEQGLLEVPALFSGVDNSPSNTHTQMHETFHK